MLQGTGGSLDDVVAAWTVVVVLLESGALCLELEAEGGSKWTGSSPLEPDFALSLLTDRGGK